MVQQGQAFVKQHEEDPFFLFWAIDLPHYPPQGVEKWRRKYADLPAPRRMYAAFISTMDDAIGRLLAKLDELNLRDRERLRKLHDDWNADTSSHDGLRDQ